MDHLNIFYPYSNKPLHHEDQLTRALLVLVKDIKAVELLFTDLIIEDMYRLKCNPTPPRLTETKCGIDLVKIQMSSKTLEELGNESGRLVSILITDEKLEPITG